MNLMNAVTFQLSSLDLEILASLKYEDIYKSIYI